MCLVGNGDKKDTVLFACEKDAANQIFQLTNRKEIRHFDQCLDAESGDGIVKTLTCHQSGGNQSWDYDEQVGGIISFLFFFNLIQIFVSSQQEKTIRHNTGSCLHRMDGTFKPMVKPCDGSEQQKWEFVHREFKFDKLSMLPDA